MCPIRLEAEDGSVEELSDDTLLVWLDETGNEDLADDRYPLFGLGGCVIEARTYLDNIHKPWVKLKEKKFPEIVALHASELRNPTPAQLKALSQFFDYGAFGRIASLVSRDTKFAKDVEAYQSCTLALVKRIEAVAKHMRFSNIAFLVEESERGNTLAQKYLGAISFEWTGNAKEIEIQNRYYFVPKKLNEPGLEVADFIMHAAGREARARAKTGEVSMGKDFKVTFKPQLLSLASYLYVNEIKRESA